MSNRNGCQDYPRIEFEGAAYHVMARGNHRGKIVFDDEDRRTFIKTLEETAEMTGWEVYFLDSRAYLARR